MDVVVFMKFSLVTDEEYAPLSLSPTVWTT